MQIYVKSEIVAEVKEWFANYVSMFQYDDQQKQQNIDLKKWHTQRVCSEISAIGKELGLNGDELRLAQIIATLHDVGRFEQYARYHTFVDRRSDNHAELGAEIITRSGILDKFDNVIGDLIIRSVRYHNRASLPPEEPEPCLFFSKLVRDADKLDIWRLVTDYYARKDPARNREIELDLPDTPGFSESAYLDLMNKKTVNMDHVKNLNDFKLLQLGWIFDINFQPTLDRAKERRYLQMIRQTLPASDRIDRVLDIIDATCFKQPVERPGRPPDSRR